MFGLIKIVLGFRSMLENGINYEASVSLLFSHDCLPSVFRIDVIPRIHDRRFE